VFCNRRLGLRLETAWWEEDAELLDSLETVYGGNDIYILLVLALLCWRRPVASLAIILIALSMTPN
jgi:hypothetical protein